MFHVKRRHFVPGVNAEAVFHVKRRLDDRFVAVPTCCRADVMPCRGSVVARLGSTAPASRVVQSWPESGLPSLSRREMTAHQIAGDHARATACVEAIVVACRVGGFVALTRKKSRRLPASRVLPRAVSRPDWAVMLPRRRARPNDRARARQLATLTYGIWTPSPRLQRSRCQVPHASMQRRSTEPPGRLARGGHGIQREPGDRDSVEGDVGG